MVPIHDTDLTEQRGSRAFQDEWAQYELWEKVEVRLKRRRLIWIGCAVLVFLMVSSVPILTDHWPKWKALTLNRKLADQINWLKREASLDHQAYRIRFEPSQAGSSYVIEKSSTCGDSQRARVSAGVLEEKSGGDPAGYAVLTPDQGLALQIPGLVNEFCYDDFTGSESNQKGNALVGFGILPVKDLTEGRMDRLSLLLLRGPSAEISFE